MPKYKSAELLLQGLMSDGQVALAQKEPLLEWYKQVRLQSDDMVSESLVALYGGFFANSAGQAFINGYEAAIQRLTGLDTKESLAAFCVTENKSTHPQSMNTSLMENVAGRLVLSGEKDFVTLAGCTKSLLVAAKIGVSEDGRNRIKLVKVDSGLPGVDVKQLPALPFVPDVAHGKVFFNSVEVNADDVYSGDGYSDFVRPFRWFEDLNVFISLSAYLFKLSLAYQWPVESKVEVISILVTLSRLQDAEEADPIAHIVMSQQVRCLERWLDLYESAWSRVPDTIAADWKRDQGILKIAEKARLARYEIATKRLSL